MTSKQRAYLKSLAMQQEPVCQIGKSSLTPEVTESVREALEARELVKIRILQNCPEEAGQIARTLSERTRCEIVQVIGRTIVAYKEGRDSKKQILLPR